MDNAAYTSITRQSGLLAEMRTIANNIANANTTGYRAENVIFAEHVHKGQGETALSLATAEARETVFTQGGLSKTGGTFDLAIEGDGFFLIQTPDGERLTRNGSFTPNQNGDLVTHDGFAVLDQGGAPVFVPLGLGDIAIAPDGTVSADGQPVGQIGVFVPDDMTSLRREDGVRFSSGDVLPVETPQILQGFVEESNVDPILQVARMVEVQRAYELGQSFLDKEDERVRAVVQALGQ